MIPKYIEKQIITEKELKVVNTDKKEYEFNDNTKTLYIPIVETDFSYMFQDFNCLKKIELCIDNEIETADYMFFRCFHLSEIKFTKKLNLKNVTNLYSLFGKCTALEEIDLSNVIVGNELDNISCMFYSCTSLKTVNFGDNFTSNYIRNIELLFNDCILLKEVKFGDNFYSENIVCANGAFNNCYNLEKIHWKKHQPFCSLKFADNMFKCCKKLKQVDLSGIDFNNTENVCDMFLNANPDLEVLVNKTYIEKY